MKAHKLRLKLFVEKADGLDLDSFVPVFHQWVKNQKVSGELLIDVADYTHVHQGPGILLVGHGVDFYIDEGQGRPGLLFARKRDAPPEADRLADTFKNALQACAFLEAEQSLSGLHFKTDEWLFQITDKLDAPNTGATLESVRPELEEFLKTLLDGTSFSLEHEGRERDPFTLRVKSSGAPDVKTLLARVS